MITTNNFFGIDEGEKFEDVYEGRVIKLTKDAKKWLPIEGSRVSVTMKRNKRKEKFMATVSVVRSASLLKKTLGSS